MHRKRNEYRRDVRKDLEQNIQRAQASDTELIPPPLMAFFLPVSPMCRGLTAQVTIRN